MDDYLSLRSLEGSGRPFGTERPSPSSERTSERTDRTGQRAEARFDRSKEADRTASKDSASRRAERDFSRELHQAEASRETQAGSQEAPAAENTELSPSHSETATETSSIPTAREAAPKQSAVQTLEAPLVDALAPAPAATPPLSRESSLSDLDSLAEAVPAPLVELPPALVPLAVLAQSAPALNTSAFAEAPGEILSADGVGAVKAPVAIGDLGANADSGFGAFDGNAGGLENTDTQGAQSASAEGKGEQVRFAQALAETAEKPAANAAAKLATAESVLRQFKVELHPKLDQATIQLHPAELGRITVRIEMDRGRLRAVMRADEAETLELLERHVPELRAALSGSGIEAESFEFGLGFDEQQAQPEQQRTSASPRSETEKLLDGEAKRQLANRIVSEVRVDTYA